jgi:hypothetical protein
VLDAAGIFLGIVLGFFIILVASDGSTDVEGKMGGNNIVNSISIRGKAVKNLNFIRFKRWAGIVNQNNLQDAMVNGITFFKGHIYLKVVIINIIINIGGNDEVASGGVRDGDLVERGNKQIIHYPSLIWVVPIHPLRW